MGFFAPAAGAAAGHIDPPVGQHPDIDLRPAHAGRQVDNVGGAVRRGVDLTSQSPGAGQQPVPQGRHMGGVFRKTGRPLLRRRGKGGDLGHGLGAGAQAVFLISAVDQGRQVQALPDIQGAAALEPADLVGGQAHQVDAVHGQVDLAKGLHRVHVEQRAGAHLRHGGLCLPDGQHCPGLVAYRHQAHQHGIGPQGRPDGLRRNAAVPLRRRQRHLKALVLHGFEGVQGGVVLDGGGHDVPPQVPQPVGRAPEGGIGAFAAAGGKGDAAGLHAQGRRHPAAAVFQQRSGALPHGVQGAGVAELVHSRKGRLPRPGQHRRGGGVIQIMFHV